MSKFRVLPLVFAISMASQAQAADLLTIARDALANNASLAASQAGYSSTKEGIDIARGALLPQITASGSMTHYDVVESQSSSTSTASAASATDTTAAASTNAGTDDDHYTSTAVSVQATQALFDATNWYNLEAAKRSAAQEALTLAEDRQQVLYDVANAYFEVLRARDQLDALRAEERAIGRQREQTQEQFNVGVIASTDVQEAEASYDQVRAERIAQESTLEVNFEALERLTGKRYASIDGLADDLPIEHPQPSSRSAWVEMANSQNLALQAARAGIDIARANVDVARAGHYPTLDAVAAYDYSRSSVDYLRGHGEEASIGVQLSLPIYTGGSTSAQVRQNTYLLEQAQFQAEDQLRDASQQVRSYFSQVASNVLSVAAYKRAIESNRSSLEATRNGYEVGTRTIVDVLDAQENLYTAIYNYAGARYDYVLNLLALRQQAGILDTDSLDALNKWLRADKPVSLDIKQDTGDIELGNGQYNNRSNPMAGLANGG
ncbi:TolC family outer membrane protein [Phytohalomonas tamaricis]|uniref:TolC family outer membrane protein n=1 Tax=Phytohalomonas tamaricis TaxID=2081032 RepID=UPI000D0B18CD|nr:TolC family outer membrane protein [Phytohalomonas tamaricis]